MPTKETFFANPNRLEHDEVLRQSDRVIAIPFVSEVLNAFPQFIVIVNDYRQVVFANDIFLKAFGVEKFEDALGQRPGELIQCIHANQTESGCGTAIECRYCGVVLTLLESQKTEKEASNDARITIKNLGKIIPLDINVMAKPIQLDNEPYTLSLLVI
ncbi:MAG: hypothetical protein FK734_05375 [Asgard group archaeon]|nr:hypothetical protein [Asgard group archaeon]